MVFFDGHPVTTRGALDPRFVPEPLGSTAKIVEGLGTVFDLVVQDWPDIGMTEPVPPRTLTLTVKHQINGNVDVLYNLSFDALDQQDRIMSFPAVPVNKHATYSLELSDAPAGESSAIHKTFTIDPISPRGLEQAVDLDFDPENGTATASAQAYNPGLCQSFQTQYSRSWLGYGTHAESSYRTAVDTKIAYGGWKVRYDVSCPGGNVNSGTYEFSFSGTAPNHINLGTTSTEDIATAIHMQGYKTPRDCRNLGSYLGYRCQGIEMITDEPLTFVDTNLDHWEERFANAPLQPQEDSSCAYYNRLGQAVFAAATWAITSGMSTAASFTTSITASQISPRLCDEYNNQTPSSFSGYEGKGVEFHRAITTNQHVEKLAEINVKFRDSGYGTIAVIGHVDARIGMTACYRCGSIWQDEAYHYRVPVPFRAV